METTRKTQAFTLLELLIVMGIVATLASLSAPAIQSIYGANSTNRAIGDLSGSLEMARAYAQANHTYVRVGFYTLSPSATHPSGAVVVAPMYSVDGSETAAMTSANWKPLSRPVFLGNCVPKGSLNATSPDTSADSDPFSAASSFGVLALPIAEAGSVSFSYFVQFTPAGEACLKADQPVRYVKIGMAPLTGKAAESFLLRLSGINGAMTVLRQENMQ
ncbi:MAG: Tfp pilus assembly protein FimT/FimU [Chthoniobacteraceae bacterium]